MNLRPALTAALDLLADASVASISVHRDRLGVCVLDPAQRRAIADELGADDGRMAPGGIVTHTAIVTTDAGELLVEVFGKADAEDWRRRDEQQWGTTLAARPVTA